MGGQRSEVSDGTTRILLESAWFEPSGIRRTSKRQGLKSEASLRFEKGADEEGARLALDRCAELIVQLAGGRIVPGVIDVRPAPQPRARVTVRPARVRSVLGAEIAASEVEVRLSSLGLRPVAGAEGGTSVARVWEIPSWRRDLTREIDCIEEVARQRGLDTIPVVQHEAGVGETQARSLESQAIAALRAQLAARGFHEAVNYSFVAERDLDALHPTAPAAAEAGPHIPPIRVANPLTTEQGAMRTTLVAGLLRNLSSNLTRGAAHPRLYELGRVYLPGSDPRRGEGPLAWPAYEPVRVGLASAGSAAPGFWGDAKGQQPPLPAEERDFFELKGALEDLVRAVGVAGLVCRVPAAGEAPHLHPAASAIVTLDGLPIGSFGKVHPLVARHFDLPPHPVVAELELAPLLAKARRASQSRGLPRFPSVGRDLAFVVRAGVPADALLAAIRGADGKGLLESVSLFDLYRGAQVPAGQKSLAFQLVLRAADRTLTDAEADGVVAAVVDRLRTDFQAEIRA
jgi:phenylalanyl-tRNA synthetase beta chain